MKFYITPHEQFITLEHSAEFFLARKLVAAEYGPDHYLAERLAKLVCKVTFADVVDPVSFSGDEQQIIVESLHNQALREEDSWYSAQAAHMLASAI